MNFDSNYITIGVVVVVGVVNILHRQLHFKINSKKLAAVEKVVNESATAANTILEPISPTAANVIVAANEVFKDVTKDINNNNKLG